MLDANYDKPFRFVCMTDDTKGLIDQVESMPLPDMVDIPAPNGDLYPSCYRRLWLFSAEAAEVFPGQIVCMDIDMVICGNVTEFFNRDEDCVMWCDPDSDWLKYAGGLWMLRTGTRTHVWDNFDPIESPKITKSAGLIGSDQAWMSYCLDGEAIWDRSHGIYKTRMLKPTDNPLILQTPNNKQKPWMDAFQIKYRRFARIWNSYAHKESDNMALYEILKNSTRGKKGEVVELHGDVVRQLQANGIIGDPIKPARSAQEPEVRKVVEPEVKKTRKKRASKAAN